MYRTLEELTEYSTTLNGVLQFIFDTNASRTRSLGDFSLIFTDTPLGRHFSLQLLNNVILCGYTNFTRELIIKMYEPFAFTFNSTEVMINKEIYDITTICEDDDLFALSTLYDTEVVTGLYVTSRVPQHLRTYMMILVSYDPRILFAYKIILKSLGKHE